MKTKLQSKQKRLGIYYTPYELSRVLSNWSILNVNDKVLEPSFGGCGFLSSSLERLKEVGAIHPKSNLFGVDIDPNAFDFLKSKIKINKSSRKFIQKSFLDVDEKEFNTKFSVILGNPPYVSYQNMDQKLRERCKQVSNRFNLPSIKRASLWMYFILHSLSLLKKTGKIAFVLPSSAVHTNYSGNAFSIISSLFESVRMIKIRKRIFTEQGTNEMAVVFLAENYLVNTKANNLKIFEVDDVLQLSYLLKLNNDPFEKRYEFSPYSNIDEINYQSICKCSEVKEIQDFYNIKIGFVTGLKKFFIFNLAKQREYKLPNSAMRPVLSNTSLAKGIDYTYENHLSNKKKNAECLVFHPRVGYKSEKIKSYLEKLDEKYIDSVKTFKKRSDWFRPDDGNIPDAFMMYLCQSGHKIILNSAKVNSTNNVHRLYLKKELTQTQSRLIAISMLSSFSQLSCETLGREYGSGALKLEPSLAKLVNVLIPDAPTQSINSYFHKINTFLDKSNLAGAMSLADSFIVKYSKLNNIEEKLKSCNKIFLNKLYKRLNTRKSYCTVNNISNLFNKSNS